MNKILKFILVIVSTLCICGVTYGITTFVKKITFNNVTINPTYQSTLDENTINNLWVGTLDLAWKKLEDQLNVNRIQLEGNEIPQIAPDLNASTFSKEMLDNNDYEIILERTDLNGLKIEATLNKELNFLEPFDNLIDTYRQTFGNSKEYIKYFGIDNGTNETVNKNVEVLFFNNESYTEVDKKINYNDFAIKLKTQEGDEIILYRTDKEIPFDEYFKEINKKTETYTGNRELTEDEEVKIPYITISGIIAYNELYGRTIKDTNGMYFTDVIQNVNFNLNEKGCNLSSTATMYLETSSISQRSFEFTDTFVLFMKEANASQPYFALKIDNTDILEKNSKEMYLGPAIIDYTILQNENYDISRIQSGEYKFYEDELYEYYYPSKKTNFVRTYFPYEKDIDNITAEEALNQGVITIDVLDRYGIEYIKKEK